MLYPKSCIKVYPNVFSSHPEIKAAKSYHKRFDEFGLKDFTSYGTINPALEIMEIMQSVSNALKEDYGVDFSCEKECLALANINYIISSFLDKADDSLKIKSIIRDDRNKTMFRSGTHLSTILNDLSLRSKSYISISLKKSLSTVKDLATSSKANKKLKVVFSTNPYDILTMSMRGIESCMRWSSNHATHLVGSVLCPNTAIIYATDGTKTEYGAKMNYRSVVRLVKSEYVNKSKTFLFVEGAYPKIEECDGDEDHNLSATEMFREVLKKKIKGNKMISGVAEYHQSDGYYIPMVPVVEKLKYQYQTCIDSELEYHP